MTLLDQRRFSALLGDNLAQTHSDFPDQVALPVGNRGSRQRGLFNSQVVLNQRQVDFPFPCREMTRGFSKGWRGAVRAATIAAREAELRTPDSHCRRPVGGPGAL